MPHGTIAKFTRSKHSKMDTIFYCVGRVEAGMKNAITYTNQLFAYSSDPEKQFAIPQIREAALAELDQAAASLATMREAVERLMKDPDAS